MTLTECLTACLGLLMTPGPTNTLLTLSAASNGRSAAFRLVPGEVTGYLMTVVPLVLFGETLLTSVPGVAVALRTAAASWVAFLAFKLWRAQSKDGPGHAITLAKVFITTLLNPKALLFGLFLLPSVENARLAATISAFVMCIGIASTLWICLGTLAHGSRADAVRRIAAVILGALSARLFISVIPIGL